MSQSVDEVLRGARLYSDGQIYRLLKLPPNAITLAAGVVAEIGSPFCAMVVDKDEVTLLIPDEAHRAFNSRLHKAICSEPEYRLITLDAVLDHDMVGLMARISDALARTGIPVLTYAAYARDHFLVSNEDFDSAIRALNTLQAAGE